MRGRHYFLAASCGRDQFLVAFLLLGALFLAVGAADFDPATACAGRPNLFRFDQDCAGGCTICQAGSCETCTRQCHAHHLCGAGAVAQCAATDAENDPTATHYELPLSGGYSVKCTGKSAWGPVGQGALGEDMTLAVHVTNGGTTGGNGSSTAAGGGGTAGGCEYSGSDVVPVPKFQQVCAKPACKSVCEKTVTTLQGEFEDVFSNMLKLSRQLVAIGGGTSSPTPGGRRHRRRQRSLLQGDSLGSNEGYLSRGTRGGSGTVGSVGDTSGGESSNNGDSSGGSGSGGLSESNGGSGSSGVTPQSLGLSPAWDSPGGNTPVSESVINDVDEGTGTIIKGASDLEKLSGLDLETGQTKPTDIHANDVAWLVAGKVLGKVLSPLAKNFVDVAQDAWDSIPNPVAGYRALVNLLSTEQCLWVCACAGLADLKSYPCEEDCSRATVSSAVFKAHLSKYNSRCF